MNSGSCRPSAQSLRRWMLPCVYHSVLPSAGIGLGFFLKCDAVGSIALWQTAVNALRQKIEAVSSKIAYIKRDFETKVSSQVQPTWLIPSQTHFGPDLFCSPPPTVQRLGCLISFRKQRSLRPKNMLQPSSKKNRNWSSSLRSEWLPKGASRFCLTP